MRLKQVQVTEFQSVRDSNPFEIGDITCLVGKNESGKTALLQALYRLNPVVRSEGDYDVIDDYPRAEVEDYRQKVESGIRDHATVVCATFTIDEDDLCDAYQELGKPAIPEPEITFTKGYKNRLTFSLTANQKSAVEYLIANAQLSPDDSSSLSTCSSADEALATLATLESTSEVNRLTTVLTQIKERGLATYIYETYLKSNFPKFLYFDEYYKMQGYANIESLQQRVAQGNLLSSDHPMLGLIALARLNLDQLLNVQRTQELVNSLEGAGNHLSRQVLKYWSQNRHLYMRFDVRPSRPGDPPEMTAGTNIWAGVHDSRHMVTTNLGTRSRGFVWFFSFLAWYSQLKRENENLILLLDEPGLSLHAKAQEDLLRYFEEELKPNHQLIYSTHSPFMVDPQHFGRVRIVQDKGIDTFDSLPPEEEGTKVLTDVLEASSDSLFPLQGALGYEIYQTLFIGPSSLIVEGVSDLLYLQTISALLQENGHEGLSSQWTITPVGGSDKVPTFVAMIGSQKGMKVATLIDIQKKDQQLIENLYKKKLLRKNRVLTFADFTGTDEADIEDMFDTKFYLRLVNEEFKTSLQSSITEAKINNKIPRVIVRLEKYFEHIPMKGNTKFSHYRPARYLSENTKTLKKYISKATLDRFGEAFSNLNALL